MAKKSTTKKSTTKTSGKTTGPKRRATVGGAKTVKKPVSKATTSKVVGSKTASRAATTASSATRTPAPKVDTDFDLVVDQLVVDEWAVDELPVWFKDGAEAFRFNGDVYRTSISAGGGTAAPGESPPSPAITVRCSDYRVDMGRRGEPTDEEIGTLIVTFLFDDARAGEVSTLRRVAGLKKRNVVRIKITLERELLASMTTIALSKSPSLTVNGHVLGDKYGVRSAYLRA